jgi:hypothetical protein
MTGDRHVRFYERPGVQLPRATHLYTIQWRAGTKATMIALADSAIEAGPR